jgi:hypothetical protein
MLRINERFSIAHKEIPHSFSETQVLCLKGINKTFPPFLRKLFTISFKKGKVHRPIQAKSILAQEQNVH